MFTIAVDNVKALENSYGGCRNDENSFFVFWKFTEIFFITDEQNEFSKILNFLSRLILMKPI